MGYEKIIWDVGATMHAAEWFIWWADEYFKLSVEKYKIEPDAHLIILDFPGYS